MLSSKALIAVSARLEYGRHRDLGGEVTDEEKIGTDGGHRAVQGAGAIVGLQRGFGIDRPGRGERLPPAQQATVVLLRKQPQISPMPPSSSTHAKTGGRPARRARWLTTRRGPTPSAQHRTMSVSVSRARIWSGVVDDVQA